MMIHSGHGLVLQVWVQDGRAVYDDTFRSWSGSPGVSAAAELFPSFCNPHSVTVGFIMVGKLAVRAPRHSTLPGMSFTNHPLAHLAQYSPMWPHSYLCHGAGALLLHTRPGGKGSGQSFMFLA